MSEKTQLVWCWIGTILMAVLFAIMFVYGFDRDCEVHEEFMKNYHKSVERMAD